MDAFLYEKADNNRVICNLCHHRCVINTGKRGKCNVRENDAGILKSLVYGKLIARSVDPVEKKPLFHLSPGSLSYSVATVGCNFRCRFCQNSDIAQMPSDRGGLIMGDPATPQEIVKDAIRKDCKSISYTYTEPTVYFEFAHDTSKIAKSEGIKNIFVTNGYMTPEAIALISPYLDAANIDLKAATDDFYRKYCGAKIDPVKDTLRQMKSLGIFIEITTLVITGLNDSRKDLESIAGFIADELGKEVPWHVSRFHPTYKLTDRRPTPVDTLSMARNIGIEKGLHYVYTGNVPGDEGEHTFCPNCKKKIIDRFGYSIRAYRIENGKCSFCKSPVQGVDL